MQNPHRPLSTRAQKAVEILSGGSGDLKKVARLTFAEALRHEGLGRKTLGEVRALLIHNGLDFRRYRSDERRVTQSDHIPVGFSDTVDDFIRRHWSGRSLKGPPV